MKRPAALTFVTAALIVLLPTLALLQYRWVGQVSEAERERMQRNVRTAAIQFREAFDGEIGRAVFGLRIDAATIRQQAWDRYADRFTTWSETAAQPGIVARVLLVDVDDGALRLREWKPLEHTFVPAQWSGPLTRWRSHFEREFAAFGERPPDSRDAFARDGSLLATPIVNVFQRGANGRGPDARGRTRPMFGFTIVQLDLDHIRRQLLPALVQQHFTNADGDVYRVAVRPRDDAGTVIYESDPAAPIDPSRADVTEPLHRAFADPQTFLSRRNGPDRRGRLDPPGNVVVEVVTEGAGSNQTTTRRVVNRDAGRWTLLVQHQSGSLEAAVQQARLRNLAVSFGILMLLTLSVVLLTLSSRRAERLGRQQMEFVAGVSHELRTPIAVIRSAAENLSQGVVGSGERVKKYGEMIDTESRRLGDMVERVLQYAGIEAGLGMVAREPLSPEDIVTSAIDAAGPSLGMARVQMEISGPLPHVTGDAAALRSAVQNLVVNAAKYGGADGWIGVRAWHTSDRRRPGVRIVVADHGAGIPADELPHIFEPFYRGADAMMRQVHGNGLGLSLVQRIVTAHGGRIAVSSRPGAGTEFSIWLPAASATARPAADTSVSAQIPGPAHS